MTNLFLGGLILGNVSPSVKYNYLFRHLESDALPGLMLDLGFFKISWWCFFLFLAPKEPYPNPAGQS